MPLWSHNANLFLSLLHHRLFHLINTGQHLGQQTLYLQLDNCLHKNNNKVVLAYLSYQVRVGGTHAILVVILLLFTFIFCSIQRHLCKLSCCGAHMKIWISDALYFGASLINHVFSGLCHRRSRLFMPVIEEMEPHWPSSLDVGILRLGFFPL